MDADRSRLLRFRMRGARLRARGFDFSSLAEIRGSRGSPIRDRVDSREVSPAIPSVARPGAMRLGFVSFFFAWVGTHGHDAG